MKIGITCYPTYGGSGVVATELGMELAQREHEVHFITYSPPIRLGPHPNIHYHEVEVSHYPLFEYPPYDLALATRMAEVAQVYGLDLLHVHYAIPHSVSAMLAKQMLAAWDTPSRGPQGLKPQSSQAGYGTAEAVPLQRSGPQGLKPGSSPAGYGTPEGVPLQGQADPEAIEKLVGPRRLPYVTTLHGTDITIVGADRSYLPITRYAIEASDGVTSISQYLKDRTIVEFDVRNEIRVIPNFVNCDVYRRDPGAKERRLQYAQPKEKLLVHLSNFRPVKRITDVIEIFDRVQKKIPARLLMIGDGPERSTAEWLAMKKNIHERVEFLGKQGQVYEKLACCDLMLMPSELESFGLAALEAMACEVPCIATNVGGVPEVIQHGYSGFLAEVGDVDTMAQYAIELLADEKKLAEMRQVVRFEAQARFCASKIIPKYEEFYREVLARSAAAPSAAD